MPDTNETRHDVESTKSTHSVPTQKGHEEGKTPPSVKSKPKGHGGKSPSKGASKGKKQAATPKTNQNQVKPAHSLDGEETSAPIPKSQSELSEVKAAPKSQKHSQGRRHGSSIEEILKIKRSKFSQTKSGERQEQFIFSMLDLSEGHLIAHENTDTDGIFSGIPAGLEVLSTMISLRITKREILATKANEGYHYRAYCQYDIRNRNSNNHKNIAIALESTGCPTTFCCADARLFDISLYDYKAALMARVRRRCSCSFCFAKYYVFCCWTGWNGCGNKLEVYNSSNELIGTVKQCTLFTTRLMYLLESNNGHPSSKSQRSTFSWGQIFCHFRKVWRDIQVKKFVVLNAQGEPEVRIEQYLPGGNLFKFIYLEDIFNAGYVRRADENTYNVELWKYFNEKQKAVMICACFLVDHVCFNISIDGSYVSQLQGFPGYKDEELCRSRCHRWLHYNRFRRFQCLIFTVLILSVIIYFAIAWLVR